MKTKPLSGIDPASRKRGDNVAAFSCTSGSDFRNTKEFRMKLTITRLLTGAALAGSFALAAACSGPSSSLSPTGPTASASAASSANFSPNPLTCEEDPTQPGCEPPPPTCETDPTLPECQPPTGTPCSPGYWKNHESAFNLFCDAAALLPGDPFASCADLRTAITCKGSDASCGRHLASGALNTVSGCVESD
jgi:hypothetical protein